ncbi:MAG: coproporphyrinogen III oxidase family protein, partial [Campylobacterales bacterium]|nr:coproporphyrinogen III oxidase family protein [Campylobacterales bacterium]
MGAFIVYIHIPFCDSKCGYCSFNSFTDKSLIDEYFKKLYIQLENDLSTVKKIDTVYIGGGTPSSVEAKYYEKIFRLLPKVKEFTVEANP